MELKILQSHIRTLATLILAGNPQMTAQVRKALPKHLADKLIETVVAAHSDDISDVVATTLTHFIEQEQQESLVQLCVSSFHFYALRGLTNPRYGPGSVDPWRASFRKVFLQSCT